MNTLIRIVQVQHEGGYMKIARATQAASPASTVCATSAGSASHTAVDAPHAPQMLAGNGGKLPPLGGALLNEHSKLGVNGEAEMGARARDGTGDTKGDGNGDSELRRRIAQDMAMTNMRTGRCP